MPQTHPTRFCSLCGKKFSTNEKIYEKFTCLRCYLKNKPLFQFQDLFYLNICLECGSFSKESKVKIWLTPSTENILEIVKSAIKYFLLEPYGKKENIKFNIKILEEKISPSAKIIEDIYLIITGVHIYDKNLIYTQEIKVKLKYGHCDNCISIKQKKINAIIQLRVIFVEQLDLIEIVKEKIKNYIEQVSKKDSTEYITKIEYVKNGVDIFLSTQNQTNKIIRLLKPEYNFLIKSSKKLMSRDVQRGKNIYRIKTLIKFLPIEKEDEVITKNIKYIVDKIGKNKIHLIDTHGNRIIKNYQFFFSKKVKIQKKDLQIFRDGRK